MATTTATFTFAEDITTAKSSFTNAATVNQAGTTTGLDNILRGTKTVTATTNTDHNTKSTMEGPFTDDMSTKVYIHSTVIR